MGKQAVVVNGVSLRAVDLLILQATPFCNIDCTYCYLPGRARKGRITAEVVEAAARRVVEARLAGERLAVVWHAGEPLAIGADCMAALVKACAPLSASGGQVQHCVQTNATLIDDNFCHLFKTRNIRVGVSLDGPPHLHDRHRVTRAGRGTHERVIQGIAKLKEHGIPFDVICVLTVHSLDEPEGLYRYFEELGVRSVGFNVDEIEGTNRQSSMAEPGYFVKVRAFWDAIVRLHLQRRSFFLREVDKMLLGIRDGVLGQQSNLATLGTNISVACDGSLAVYCPELLGIQHPRFGDFSIGNVMTHSIAEMVGSPRLQEMRAEIESGVRKCRDQCSYFDVCGGGAPSNKIFEHGTFDVAETKACRAVKQSLVDAILNACRPTDPIGGEENITTRGTMCVERSSH